MKKFFNMFVNQIYIIKKAWGFSKLFFVCRLIIAVLTGVMPALNAYMYKLFVDKIMLPNWTGALQIVLIIALIGLVNATIRTILNRKIGIISDLFRNALLFDIQSTIVNMDYNLLFSPEMMKKKELAVSATSGNIATRFLDSTFSIISAIISIISIGYILSTVSMWVFLIFAILTALKILISIIDKRSQYNNTQELIPLNRRISYYMSMLTDEVYANDMRMLSISQWVIKKYKETVSGAQRLAQKLLNKIAQTSMIGAILRIIETSMYYIFLAAQVIFYKMTFANFTMFFSALNTFSDQITIIANSVISVGESSVYINAFRDFMETKNIIAVPGVGISADSIASKNIIYSFNQMSFKYPGNDEYVLKNINIDIEPNKFYVIVGENGQGKSTLCKLICRLYDVNNGKILYNGTDIREIEYKSYRNLIGMVFQDYKYYNLSIAENVAMNEYNNTDEIRMKIYNCLAEAGLKNKIDSLPQGIDTQLGQIFDEHGVLLSGGETQKLALARVLFKNPPIVILDEPSSALDAFAEDELIQTFNRTLENKTVFYISHRLSVAKYAYKVIFLSEHSVCGYGTHEELLKTCSKYAEMYHAQAKHYTEEGYKNG